MPVLWGVVSYLLSTALSVVMIVLLSAGAWVGMIVALIAIRSPWNALAAYAILFSVVAVMYFLLSRRLKCSR